MSTGSISKRRRGMCRCSPRCGLGSCSQAATGCCRRRCRYWRHTAGAASAWPSTRWRCPRRWSTSRCAWWRWAASVSGWRRPAGKRCWRAKRVRRRTATRSRCGCPRWWRAPALSSRWCGATAPRRWLRSPVPCASSRRARPHGSPANHSATRSASAGATPIRGAPVPWSTQSPLRTPTRWRSNARSRPGARLTSSLASCRACGPSWSWPKARWPATVRARAHCCPARMRSPTCTAASNTSGRSLHCGSTARGCCGTTRRRTRRCARSTTRSSSCATTAAASTAGCRGCPRPSATRSR
ncbi:hypothetical protein D9M68_142880 [compost metagenome]